MFLGSCPTNLIEFGNVNSVKIIIDKFMICCILYLWNRNKIRRADKMAKKVYAIKEGFNSSTNEKIENRIVDTWAECL